MEINFDTIAAFIGGYLGAYTYDKIAAKIKENKDNKNKDDKK